MKRLYRIKRNSCSILLDSLDPKLTRQKRKKKQASMLKNTMFNKKEMFLFTITGIVKVKKINTLNKSFVFVGNTSRTSIKYAFDYNYPGVELF